MLTEERDKNTFYSGRVKKGNKNGTWTLILKL